LLAVMVVGCLASIQLQYRWAHSAIQAAIAGTIVFFSATALEGPSMLLLSGVVPKSWRTGVANIGLWASEADSIGRVLADVVILLFASHDAESASNVAFGLLALAAGVLLVVSKCADHHLEYIDFEVA
jgi:hypothetical protein